MTDKLSDFLKPYQPQASEEVRWAEGRIQLRLDSYLAQESPPLNFITSVRGVVFQGDTVLVVRYPDGVSILPGGRREEGEEIEATLRRELLEETGWGVGEVQLLGFRHFHHVTDKPAGYRYPYPDFVQLVYAARAVRCVSQVGQENGTDLEWWFCPFAETAALDLNAGERVFLAEAANQAI